MSRPYSSDFIEATNASTSTRTGVLFAKACIKANLPAIYVASIMNVSRMTIYSWFRGKPLRDKNEEAVKLLISIIENDIISGILPAKGLPEAKLYLEEVANKIIEDDRTAEIL
jgi:hypothetical protein